MPKDAVRDYARSRGLPVADKPDSQEICFIPDHDYARFVTQARARRGARRASIVDERGRVLGRHAGIHRFTVGQRKGLGLRHRRPAAPMYVLALRPADQQVVVGPKASLERTTLTASGVNWIVGRRRRARARHRPDPPSASGRRPRRVAAARATAAPKSSSTRRRSPITPGQAVVFYDGDVVVGGGWID